MKRSLDGLAATFALGLVVLGATLTAAGAVVGLVRGDELGDAVGWSLAVGGTLVALLVGGSGSTSVNHHGSQDVVVGAGHVIGARVPLPRTSLVWALVGFMCAEIGIAVVVA